MTVPLPRLLDSSLNEICRLHPLVGTLTLSTPEASEATLTIAPEETHPNMHQWVELFTLRGSAGYYRVTAISRTYTGETQLTLRHGIDTLSDSLYRAQAEEASYTVAQMITNILSYQTASVAGNVPWQLGTCEDTSSIRRAVNYDNCAEMLRAIAEEKQNYWFTYDFSTHPWTLNFVSKPQQTECEFRLSRNIESLSISMDDSALCTQLHLSVNVQTTTTPTTDTRPVDPSSTVQVNWPTLTSNESAVRVYDNAEAQAEWGIVQKSASIDTQGDVIGQGYPNADAWAARYMEDHSKPTLQIQISGDDLYALTGDHFDEMKLGVICCVALPDHNAIFNERVISVSYPDLYNTPTAVTVSLANRLPKFSNAITKAQKETEKAESTAKTAKRSAGGGGGGTAKELESWAQIVKKVKEAEDSTGITELYESGVILDAQQGVQLYSIAQGFVSQHGEIKVNSDKVSIVVEGTTPGSYKIKSASIITSINDDGSGILLSADKIEVDGLLLTTQIQGINAHFTGAVAVPSMRVTNLVAAGYGCSWVRVIGSNGTFWVLGTYDI